jgi:uncharacterized membrane protein YqjE
MATTPTENGSRRDAPISELIRSLIADVALLVRREAELARIELKEKASKIGVAVGMFATGAVMAFFAVATLVAAAVLALAIVLPAWAAALVVAVVLLVIAAALVLAGRAQLREAAPLAPTRTLDTVQEDITWMRSKTEQLKTSE